jgi:hypothetical protein
MEDRMNKPTAQTALEEINVGDTVRSFDFPDRYRAVAGDEACYYVGVVEQIGEPIERDVAFTGCRVYSIRVTARYWEGRKLSTETRYVYPPVNGTEKLFGGVTDGVELV